MRKMRYNYAHQLKIIELVLNRIKFQATVTTVNTPQTTEPAGVDVTIYDVVRDGAMFTAEVDNPGLDHQLRMLDTAIENMTTTGWCMQFENLVDPPRCRWHIDGAHWVGIERGFVQVDPSAIHLPPMAEVGQ